MSEKDQQAKNLTIHNLVEVGSNPQLIPQQSNSPNPRRLSPSNVSFNITPDKQGILLKRAKGFLRSGWSEKYFILCGETLYYYKRTDDQVPRTAIHLRNSNIFPMSDKVVKKKHAFCIKDGKKEMYLACKDGLEYEDWLSALAKSMIQELQPPPIRNEIVKKSTSNKMAVQTRLFDYLSRFNPSKKVLMEFMTDDTLTLIESLKSFVTKYDSSEKALLLEKIAISVGFRLALLYEEKKIPKEYFFRLTEPTHRLCDKMIDGYELPFLYNSTEMIACLMEVNNSLNQTFGPYFNDKTKLKLQTLFNYFMNEELLDDLFTKKKWKECADLAQILRQLWDAGLV